MLRMGKRAMCCTTLTLVAAINRRRRDAVDNEDDNQGADDDDDSDFYGEQMIKGDEPTMNDKRSVLIRRFQTNLL